MALFLPGIWCFCPMAFTSLALCSESSVNASTKSSKRVRHFPRAGDVELADHSEIIVRRMLSIHHVHTLWPVRSGLFCPPLLTPAPPRPGRGIKGEVQNWL